MSALPSYYKEDRPWGSFERFIENEKVTVKFMHMAPGKRVSLQKHAKRSEYWRFFKGSGTVQIDDTVREVKEGDEAFIPVGALHRVTGGPEGLSFLEIMTGEYDEDDIERVEDDFGRTP